MTSSNLTVVVLSYGDEQALEDSLLSLRRQSLSRDNFQVLLLRYEVAHSKREVTISLQGLSSVALDRDEHRYIDAGTNPRDFLFLTRRSEYFIFLAEGDLLSTYFLEAMVNAAEENLIPVSQVVEVLPKGRGEHRIPTNLALPARDEHTLSLSECPIEFLKQPFAKLFRRDALANKHMEYISEADWLSLQVSLALNQAETSFSKFPAAVGATYYETRSVGRTLIDSRFNHSVNYAFRTLENLQAFRKQDVTETQKSFLSNIEAHFMLLIQELWQPDDKRTAFQTVADLPLRGLPWDVMNEPVDTVAVVANFAPYAGTAGLVAGKRIVDRGKRIDLISSVVSSRKRFEKDLVMTEPYVRNHRVHSPSIEGDNDVDFRHFVDDALSTLQLWRARGAKYQNIYSRSMMPHSHIVAAIIKRQNPEWRWIAEFSDPNSVDAQGRKRLASFQNESLFPELQGWGTAEQQRLLLNDLRLFRWAELLPYFYADEVLFTNENQKEVMLASAPSQYRASIREKSIVVHHPTLPPGYYELSEPDVIDTEGAISLAYFGNFYDTRGLGEVIEALNQLCDFELLRFRLFIYTGSGKGRIYSHFPRRVRQVMELRPRLNFLKSLATMNRMDYLIVNDADTSEHFALNPFLPSKVSDYKGSKARVWAIVEEGSVLSKLQFDLRSELGDQEGAFRV